MGLYNFALFQVGIKTIIKKEEDILLLITKDGKYDFPGGRIDESEVDLPLAKVLEREVKEELGSSLIFKVEKLAFIAKREYSDNGQKHKILAVYFEARYLGGDIVLSNEHTTAKWVKPKSILETPDKFISKDEYQQLKEHLG